MAQDKLMKRVDEAIRRQAKMSPQALIDSMVKRGAIAPDGTVLVRMPTGPEGRSKTRQPAMMVRPTGKSTGKARKK